LRLNKCAARRFVPTMRTIPASRQMAARTNQSATFFEPVKGSVPAAGAAVVVVTAATATTFVVVVTVPVAPTAMKLFGFATVQVNEAVVVPIGAGSVSFDVMTADFWANTTFPVGLVGVQMVLGSAEVTVSG
jgi:hypothetical protein